MSNALFLAAQGGGSTIEVQEEDSLALLREKIGEGGLIGSIDA